MKINLWTVGLATAGVVSLASVASAEEGKPSQVLTALSSTTLSGYVSTSGIWRPGDTDRVNAAPGRLYDVGAKHDGFNLDVFSLTLEKPLDEGDWSAGYHVQLLVGPDAVYRGTGLAASTLAGTADIASNEAYVSLRAPVGNGIDFKVGQFGTFVGYEAYDYYKNPNYSRSYGFWIEPSAHTGITASYAFTDYLNAVVGVGNSYSTFIDARPKSESQKTYLALVTFTAPESFGFMKGATLTAGYTGGLQHGVGDPSIYNYYAGLAMPLPIEGLSLGVSYDYQANAVAAATGSDSSYGNATALYLSYQATEKLRLNARADYATGTAGTFYGGGDHNELLGLTFTVDYKIWANVLSRAEVRYDRALESGDRPFGDVGVGNGDKDSLTLAFNLVYQF